MASSVSSLSRTKIQNLISAGAVRVNDVIIVDASYYLKVNDCVTVDDSQKIEKPNLSPDASVQFDILYEDADLLVIDKPAGVVVHAGAGNFSHTLVNGLVHHCGKSLSSGSDEYRPGIVHRIDKDTSGILVVAKNDYSHAKLAEQFAVHSITRKYICFCYSHFQNKSGKIETLIARDQNNRLKMSVNPSQGKTAITLFKTLVDYGYASKIECELKTGRTHQIRVHMSYLGHSLIGDSLYKTKNYSIPKNISEYIRLFPRQALHAYYLKFCHPCTQKEMEFFSDIPSDMQQLEEMLRNAIEK